MRRYLFVSACTSPIVAYAHDKQDMRTYVRAFLGCSVLPRHAVVSVA